MFTKTCKALLMLMALLAATKSFSQCSICSTPAAPVEYGGVWNATYYKGATLQLWAVNPAVAVCELDWYHVVGTDTTFLGTGDTLSTVTDTTCQYIARTKNTCSGGSTYYSSYIKMASITVVTGTIPTNIISMSPTICSGTPTDILLWSATNGVAFNYLRGDTPSVTGSLSGTSYTGPMSVTLTNTTGSSQTVRMVIRMRTSSYYYANDEVIYFTVLASTASSGDHCYAPSSPAPIYGWTGSDGVSPGMFCKGSTIQMEADSTITADSVQWYKVVGTDTTYAGQGYWISVTTDTSCQYIARNANHCSCSSSLYYSAWASMAVYQVTSSYSPPNMHITNFMPTIASGTQVDIGVTLDSSGIGRIQAYRDNAYVSCTLGLFVAQSTGEINCTFTNTTSVPQVVRLWVVSAAWPPVSGVNLNGANFLYGNSQLLYVTVLPSTTTGTGHCTMPPIQNQYSPGNTSGRDGHALYYVKGATINLDLGNKFDDVITADSVYWYKTRWPGDTSYLGNSYPINTVADTNFSVFTVTNNVCYWSDGTKHIYTSMKSQVGTINVASATNPVVVLTNNVPTICNGQATNICVSAPYSSIVSWDWGNTWLSGALPKITAKQSVGNIYYYFPALVSDSLTDTASTSQVVNFEASSYVYVGSQQYRGSSALTSVTVLPTAATSGNHCFAPAVPKPFTGSTDTRTYCKGAQIVMLADTTVIADSVQWYKVVYGDTVYAGQGYTISVTVDTNCQYLARNLNMCDCSSPGTYYSVWTLMANYSVTTAYTASTFWITNNMPTIASGTQIDLVPGIDSSAFVDFGLYMDNANVTGTKSVTANNNISGLGITLTNSTTVPQTVRYWILSETSSYIGNTLSGSIIVLPSGSTAPTGNHCLYPPSINPSITSTLQTDCYVKGATANLDLNHITESPTPFYYTAVAADSVDWYKSRWPGDTTWLGNSYPVNALADTGCTIYTVSKNVCYWSDSSKHVYSSIQSRVLRMNVLSGTNPTVTLVNNTPYTCSGVPTNIQVTGTNSTIEWMRDNTPKVTGPLEAGIRTTTATIIDTLRDTTTVPQVVHFEVEAFTTISGQTCWGSSALTGVTVNPPCGSWANIATGVYPNNDSICSGATATLTADTLPCAGGTIYIWSSGDTTQSITKSTAGTYTVTATNTCGCSATASGTIVIRSNPSPTVNSPSICSGTTATMTATGGSHYLWSNADTTASFTTGTAGTYTVTATNTYGCSATANGTLTVNANPTPTVNNDTICSGATATLTATGGTSYIWSTSATTTSITTGTAGTYTVTATNAAGCTATASGTVMANSLPTPSVNNDTVCSGVAATLTAAGGATYLWSTSATTSSITTTTAGTYTVTATNSSGCSATASGTVIHDSLPIPTVNNDTICTGDIATLTASGGSSYLWSTGDTSASISIDSAGTYTGTVTNAYGCSATATGTVIVHIPATPIVTNDTICEGATASISVITAETGYDWNTGDTTSSIYVTQEGSYTVMVLDSFGCANYGTGTVVILPNPLPYVDTVAVCSGDTASLTAIGGTSYLWSNSDTGSIIKLTSAGTYNVTVTNLYGCSATGSGVVSFNTSPSASITVSHICSGSEPMLIANGGVSYHWSTGDTTAVIRDSVLGSYTVTVTSAFGCTATASIRDTGYIAPSFTVNNDTICAGSSGVLTATYGGSYLWSTGDSTASINVDSAGTYTVTVTTSSGCTATASGVVTVLSVPTPIVSNDTVCNDMSGILRATGGTSYIWSTGERADSIVTEYPGTYTVIATNANGCSASASGTLVVKLGAVTVNNSVIYVGDTAVLTALGGTSYVWNSGDSTSSIRETASGAYTVTATDSSGCTVVASGSVTVTTKPGPILFVQNEGQYNNDSIKYQASSGGILYRFLQSGISFANIQKDTISDSTHVLVWNMTLSGMDTSSFISGDATGLDTLITSSGEKFINNYSGGIMNYYIGNDSSKWHSNVPTYSALTYTGVYNNIDLKYFSADNTGNIEYDFIVYPGGNMNNIKLLYSGIDSIHLDSSGNADIATRLGPVTEMQPKAYQMVSGSAVNVPVSFTLDSMGSLGFVASGGYDTSLPLVIDPCIQVWSTFWFVSQDLFAVSAYNQVNSNVADNTGVYIGGTLSTDLFYISSIFTILTPIYNKYFSVGGNYSNQLGYISKFAPDATSKIWTTIFGGNPPSGPTVDQIHLGINESNTVFDLKTDASQLNSWTAQNVYACGATQSTNFPKYPSGSQVAQLSNNLGLNYGDAFISAFSAATGVATYINTFGGSENDAALKLALDNNTPPNIYITGFTESENFGTGSTTPSPLINNSSDPPSNVNEDIFMVELNPANISGGIITGLIWGSTGLLLNQTNGQNPNSATNAFNMDWGHDIRFYNNQVYVAGFVNNNINFPKVGSLAVSPSGQFRNGFLTILAPGASGAKSGVFYSTALGASAADNEMFSMDIDNMGNVFLLGITKQGPTSTSNTPFTGQPGTLWGFIAELTPDYSSGTTPQFNQKLTYVDYEVYSSGSGDDITNDRSGGFTWGLSSSVEATSNLMGDNTWGGLSIGQTTGNIYISSLNANYLTTVNPSLSYYYCSSQGEFDACRLFALDNTCSNVLFSSQFGAAPEFSGVSNSHQVVTPFVIETTNETDIYCGFGALGGNGVATGNFPSNVIGWHDVLGSQFTITDQSVTLRFEYAANLTKDINVPVCITSPPSIVEINLASEGVYIPNNGGNNNPSSTIGINLSYTFTNSQGISTAETLCPITNLCNSVYYNNSNQTISILDGFLSAMGSGTYTFTFNETIQGDDNAQDQAYTCPVLTLNVHITVTDNQSTSITPTVACFNSPITCTSSSEIGATPGPGNTVTYLWSGSITESSNTTQSVTPNNTGTYTVTAYYNGCSATASITVSAPPTINITESPSSGTICINGVAQLTVSGLPSGYTYQWSSLDANLYTTIQCSPSSAYIATDNVSTVYSNPTSNSSYSVTVTDGGCSATSGAYILVGPNMAPTVSVSGSPQTICPTSSLTLTATPSPSTGTYTYAWSAGTPSSNTDLITSATPPAQYTVTVTDGNQCTAVATYNYGASINTPDGTNVNTCNPNSTGVPLNVITSNDDACTFIWSTGVSTQDITAFSPGVYTVTITESTLLTTCTVVESVTVTGNVNCCSGSPNGSGGTYTYYGGPPVNPLDLGYYVSSSTVLNTGSQVALNGYWIVTPAHPVTVTNGTTLLMGPNSLITVQSGGHLTIEDGSVLEACGNEMWLGITVEDGGNISVQSSSIEDAKVGITGSGVGIFAIGQTNFYRDNIGIEITGSGENPFSGTGNYINECNFVYDPVNVPSSYPLLPPYSNMFPEAGIVVVGNSYAVIGDFNRSTVPNKFSGLNAGIVNLVSNVTVNDDIFENIHNYNHTNNFYDGAGVAASIFSFGNYLAPCSTTVATLQSSPTASISPTFSNCSVGIWSSLSSLNAYNNAMQGTVTDTPCYGIFTASSIGKNITITDNFIGETGTSNGIDYGITLEDNTSAPTTVSGNTITVNPPTNPYCIFRVGCQSAKATYGINESEVSSTKQTQVAITGNTITGGLNSITLTNANRSLVYDNAMNLNDNNTLHIVYNPFSHAWTGPTWNGVSAQNCTNLYIEENTMTGNGTTYDDGLIGTTVSSSNTEYRRSGIGLSSSTNSQICGNSITNFGYSFNYVSGCNGTHMPDNAISSAKTGVMLNYNGVIGVQGNSTNPPHTSFGGTFSVTDETYANNSFGPLSDFYYYGTEEPFPNGSNLGFAFEVQPILSSSNFLTFCAIPVVHHMRYASTYALAAAQGDLSGYLGDSTYYDGDLWMAQLQLYQALTDDTSLLNSDTTYQDFYTEAQSGAIGASMQASAALAAIGAATDSAQLDSLIGAASTSNTNLSLYAAPGLVYSPHTVFCGNACVVNSIYLRTVARGLAITDTTDLDTIFSLAHSCPFAAGDAVYMARSLYALCFPMDAFDDASLCTPTDSGGSMHHERPRDADSTVMQPFATVVPNPTSGKATVVYFSAGSEINKVELYDGIGGLVLVKTDPTNSGRLDIDVSHLAPGIYMVRFTSDEKVLLSTKLVIEH